MAKHETSSSSLASDSERDNSSEEEPESFGGDVGRQGASAYEKQRMSRIAENKARMEALGLHRMASSLMGSVQKPGQTQKLGQRRKGRSKVGDDDDEDYRPNDDDANDDDDDADDEDNQSSSLKARGRKVKNNESSNTKKKVAVRKQFNDGDYIDEDDGELMQAIALSLQESAKDVKPKERKGVPCVQEDARRKRKQSFSSRVKMTEDEIILHFFQFDESGNGRITVRDLRRVATAHDFTWTDKEMADMIRFFDGDGDGQLNLDDFRKIVDRCNMIQGPENN